MNWRLDPQARARLVSLAWILLPSAVVALLVLGLIRWRVPTAVAIDVSVRRAELRTHGTDPRVLLDSAEVRSVAVRGFEELRLSPEAVWIAHPAKYDLERDTYPDSAWTALSAGQSLILRPAGSTAATVTIRPAAKSGGALVLDRVFAGRGDVILESPEPGSLAVKLLGQRQPRALSLPGELWLVADYCASDGAPWPQQGQSVTLRVRPRKDSRLLEFSSSESGVLLAVVYLPGRKEPVLTEDFAVEQAQFLDQGLLGRPVSTLTERGTIRYVDYPGIDPVQLNANDFLVLGGLRNFLLRRVELMEHKRGLRLLFRGVAGRVSSGPENSTRDLRLTQFDILWRSRALVTLFTVLVWLVPTLLAMRRFYRELHN
jgi:hypothetical protein